MGCVDVSGMVGRLNNIISIIVLASVTSNMGIAVRQKTMFMPGLIAIYCIKYSKQRTFSVGERLVLPISSA